MATRLTTKWLDAQVGRRREKRINVTDPSGLGVRVTQAGKVVFQWRYRWGGRQKTMDLGEYPATGLKAAKDEMLKWMAVLDSGKDPVTVLRMSMATELTAQTNEELIRVWFDRYLRRNRKHIDPIIKRFETHVFPVIGHLPAKDTERRHWLTIFDRLVDQGKHGMADKLLADAKQALAFAENRDPDVHNSLASLTLRTLGVQRQQGERVLTDAELRDVWTKTDDSPLARKNQLMIQLLLLFGCRTVELRLAEKSHFDLDAGIWTTPRDLTKSLRRPVLRPIQDRAKEMLEELFDLHPGRYLLPKKDGRPVSHSSPVKSQTVLRRWLGHEHWTLHDLRRTARTHWSAYTAPHVAEKMLGHKLAGIMAVYDQHDYLDDQRRAYEHWITELDSLSESNVVILKKTQGGKPR